ncbi:hypothetical protein OMO38_15945 [Chryseobacterium sp. 09-1422]|uniref:Uncharacterized protein n=1 Tax=Chryseobacterium kimseyorum TaxID=2984028 RepID=A0ABT3I1T8_9FLAO|nr:hypothetical protein [Chryseobacterium kimseyorum]MCW3170017.1 hypothetical protein [Chryseobacterium kimseyorum]
MDIVKYIKQHTENLQNGLAHTSTEQRQDLKVTTLGFYALLPNFQEVVSKYIKIDFDIKQLISDIKNENVENYRKQCEKSNAEIDVYSEDYEEPEQLEIFILDAFENSVSETKNIESLVGLLIGVIDTLDYYENFSDEPEYWNDLLEKEVGFQNEILTILKTKGTFNTSIYQNRYENVEFSEL